MIPFETYYRQLMRKADSSFPHVDEAKRDYLATVNRTLDGFLVSG